MPLAYAKLRDSARDSDSYGDVLLVVVYNAGENTIDHPFGMPLPAAPAAVRIERGTRINSSRRSLGGTAH